MPIPFACPHCGLRTEVAEQYAGRSGPCAGCGRIVTVPSPWPHAPYLPRVKRVPAVAAILLIVVGGVVALLICSGLLTALGFAPERLGRF